MTAAAFPEPRTLPFSMNGRPHSPYKPAQDGTPQACLVTIIAIALFPLLLLYRGLAASLIWGWHVTAWTGIVAPTTITAAAIMCLLLLIPRAESKKSKKPPTNYIFVNAIAITLLLGFAYLLYSWN